ncbi:MAG: transcriptional regulator/antitoxin, MazE [Candidatus Hydrogenedentes bacterium]|nr:transcriptional regulator/antitoxin, MazE [Candidatus Hydrogenedentota bacterium]
MKSKVQRWGKSQGVRISKKILARAGISVGDCVDVVVRDGVIVVTPVRQIRGKRDLRKLVTGIPKGYLPKEWVWGAPVGKEVW